MIYIVSYDLHGPADRYATLLDVLKKQGDSWCHYLRNTWLISTYKNPQQIFADIRPYLDEKDRVLVVGCHPPYQGWLPKDAWEWVQKFQDSPGYPLGASGNLFAQSQAENPAKNL